MTQSAESESSPAFALRPGTVIGSYTIRRMLGYGGFGITYAAEHRLISRQVAIKELYPVGRVHRDATGSLVYSKAEAPTIAWALDKFEATTTTLCALDHPNIVRMYDYLKANETGYMIMELLDGQTLERWLERRETPPSVDDLMPIVEPVMDALAYVHGQGLIHRDVAPDNILITDKGRPVLIDFGSVSRDLTASGPQSRSGTTGQSKRHYTAPEQIRAKAKPTPEADVYSMGAVLYRALSGAAPPDGLDRILVGPEGDPHEPLARRCPPGCPMPAAQAIDKALALKPDERFRGMAQLRDGMKAHAPGRSTPEVKHEPEVKPETKPEPETKTKPETGTKSEPQRRTRRARIPFLPTTVFLGLASLVAAVGAGHLTLLGGFIVAATAAVSHRLLIRFSIPNAGEIAPASRFRLWTHRASPSQDTPPAAATPADAPSRRRLIRPALLLEVGAGLAVFAFARLATDSQVASFVAAFGAVLALAVTEKTIGSSRPATSVEGIRRARLRDYGRGLLLAAVVAAALLPLNGLFPAPRAPSPPPAVQPTPDPTPAADDTSPSAPDEDTSPSPRPHTRSCRRSKRGCRK